MLEQTLYKKPERWDVPFWQELPDPAQRLEMTDGQVAQLLAMPPFDRMKPTAFPAKTPLADLLQNDTRIRLYRPGDVVVRKGEYGNSAFLVLDGSVGVVQGGLNLDWEELERRKQPRSIARSLAGIFFAPRSPEARDARLYPQMSSVDPEHAERGVFLQDIPGVLSIEEERLAEATLTTIGAGQMFGELGALGRSPRAATIVALKDARLLEVRWQGLRDLRLYDQTLRQTIDAQYREYGLRSTLESSELLSHIRDRRRVRQIVDELARPEHSNFETYGSFEWYGAFKQLRESDTDPLSKEPVVAEEGTATNGVLLIRAGYARLSRRYGDGEVTFDYLGKGRIYGLPEVLREFDTGKQVPLSASLRAVGYLDVVRISTRSFEQLILPYLPESFITATLAPRPLGPGASSDPGLTEFLVENRFINATSAMVIDLDRCTGCDDCVRACASGHDNNPRFLRHGTVHSHYMVTNACMHCADPVCMIGCPTGAIRRAPSGEVVINDLTCIGCETCARNCPYHNIRMVNVRDRTNDDAMLLAPVTQRPITKATKCDLCVGHHGGPACVRACPHDALVRLDLTRKENVPAWLGH